MSSTLASLQQNFLSAISAPQSRPIDAVLDTETLSAAQRMAIYHNAYFQRLQEVLQQDYPTVHGLIGDDMFSQLAKEYILSHPSSHTSIRWFGEQLPAFIRQTEPYQQHGILAELSDWERYLRAAFDGADATPLQSDALQTVAAEHWPWLGFVFVPTFRLCEHRFNTVAVWQALKEDNPPPDIQALTDSEYWLIWRSGLQTAYQSVSSEEAEMIQQVQQGNHFAGLCERLSDQYGEQTAQVAIGLLQKWIQAEMLQSLHLTTQDFDAADL
ncbi:putative DNA-binding domain-containing protein [Gynuella sp.]|uniref:HvfC/BufC family peptide modification chaperone n=1 Tax=Gynuella sp. TaxID=2969146 RepID=UPI003D0DA5BB